MLKREKFCSPEVGKDEMFSSYTPVSFIFNLFFKYYDFLHSELQFFYKLAPEEGKVYLAVLLFQGIIYSKMSGRRMGFVMMKN